MVIGASALGGFIIELDTDGQRVRMSSEQNFRGDAWVLLGEIDYTGGVITVTQRSSFNSFVSMRGSGGSRIVSG